MYGPVVKPDEPNALAKARLEKAGCGPKKGEKSAE